MTDKLNSFISIANSTFFSSRDIVVSKDEKVKLGNFVFSEKTKNNETTMKAFRNALADKYGDFGTHAFDTVLQNRIQLKKSLRACDIKKTLSKIPDVIKKHFKNEITRQLDSDPNFRELPKDQRALIRKNLMKDPFSKIDFKGITNNQTLINNVSDRISREIKTVMKNTEYQAEGLGDIVTNADDVNDDIATGLMNLDEQGLKSTSTSIEDHVKTGKIGSGMQINRSETRPVIFEKLKDNGVEPGFIYHYDWSLNDTRSLMMDWSSDESRQILENLKNQNDKLKEACKGLDLRSQIMKCGHLHPAGMSAVADYLIDSGMQDPKSQIHKTFESKFPDTPPTQYGTVDAAKLKKALFIPIRDAVLNAKPGPLQKMSPIFKHFSDRHIMKLDYNEKQKVFSSKAGHAGKFMRPERIIVNRKFGTLYRLNTAQNADKISVGAVTEALANDLSRIMGIPTQDLRIVRTQYSDGHPKIMLQAKFSNGYQDLEKGFIKDGRIVSPDGSKLESLGKYKAFFIATADRDGIGKRGQNKGFANGKFFAIDPGHSLEGNGKYLEVDDNLNFKDTFGFSTKPRFNNFSIFDDSTRYEKLEGVIKMRDMQVSGKIQQLFDDYRKAFDPNEDGISNAERDMRVKITADINVKEKEFNDSIQKILNVSSNQIHLYDDLKAEGTEVQKQAVETVENLEKLTSPTTLVSKDGTVQLEHLEVIQESRVPWQAHVDGDSIVYHCDQPLSASAKLFLESFAKNSGGTLGVAADGTAKLTVAKENRQKFFDTFSERRIINATHTQEAAARQNGESSLAAAKSYVSHLSQVAVNQPDQPQGDFVLPVNVTVHIKNEDVIIPRSLFESMVNETPADQRPKNVDELKAVLTARINKGNEILHDVLAGKGYRHQATTRNVACLTLLFHAATLNKNELNDRGAFSVADPDGKLYQWLDTCKEIYTRTSTHAKQYHHTMVDGHLNMPRGLDIPTGMGGLMNSMKTLHYFTLPAVNGQPRRLYLKTETHGIYNSTISAQDDMASRSLGMQTRGRRSTDVKESLLHCGSLATVFSRKGPGFGNRKEDLPNTVRFAMDRGATMLKNAGFKAEADLLIQGNQKGLFNNPNAGIRQLIENMTAILQMPRDEEKMIQISAITNEVLESIQSYADEVDIAGMKRRTGNISSRIGNEVMLDPKDFEFHKVVRNVDNNIVNNEI